MLTNTGQSLDPRELRREFQAVKEGTKRFDSTTEVLTSFTAPFIRLFGQDALPSSLRVSAGPSTRSSIPNEPLDILLIELIQESLLVRIAVDFNTALPALQLQDLLRSWFFAPLTDLPHQGVVQQCSLRTVSRLLSSPSAHPLTLSTLEQLCRDALQHLSLPALIAAIRSEQNKARANVAWGESLRLLAALPDRLANATRGKVGAWVEMWVDQVLVRGIGRCLSEGKSDTADGLREKETRSEEGSSIQAGVRGKVGSSLLHEGQRSVHGLPVKELRAVLLRLDKMGCLSKAVDTEGRGFWATLLRQMAGDQGVAQNWPELRASLGSGLRGKLDSGLVETLQYWMLRKGMLTGLVTGGERSKAGTEGTAFLGTRSHEVVAAIAQIFNTLFRRPTSKHGSNSNTSDSDTDDDGVSSSSIITDFQRIALTHTHHSPLLAWSWAYYLSTVLPPPTLLTCLGSTLSLWADPIRIKRSLVTTELYLSTLITCLLAALARNTPSLPAVARSGAVINGVSLHLESSDPAFRRLGMLVAELLSQKTAEEGGKVLNFGKGVWNGTGEGREEARVLRAVGDAWAYHVSCIDTVRKGWIGVGEAVNAVMMKAEANEGTMSASDGGRGNKSRKPAKQKTRRLPQRVDPPNRHAAAGRGERARPLITMLGSDEEDETTLPPARPLLEMFSSLRNTSGRPSSSGESSSSDGSDSDVAAEDDPDSVHRLAASLTGMSTTEASDLLNNPSISTPAPQSRSKGVGDFDAPDHAPTFTTTPQAPVYISQLSPLLRSGSRASIRLALHHAAPLIRRKASPLFGAELRENAIDLTLNLIALHDNFGITRFEQLRRDAVKELAVAEPRLVVGVLTEQGMGSQYSEVQRGGMWWALVESAVVLSRGQQVEEEGEEKEEEEERGKGEKEVEERAGRVMRKVIKEAREVGEAKVPQLRRQRGLQVGHASTRTRAKIVELHSSQYPLSTRVDRKSEWDKIAGPVYMFPLITRYLAYQSHQSSRQGSGSSNIFSPTTLSLFFSTLTVLLSLSPTHTIHEVAPSIVDLLASSISSITPLYPASPVTNSLLTLLATLLDRVQSQPHLLDDRECFTRLQALLAWSRDVFTHLQRHAPETEGIVAKVAARAASVLLLMERLDELREQRVRQLVGFVPY